MGIHWLADRGEPGISTDPNAGQPFVRSWSHELADLYCCERRYAGSGGTGLLLAGCARHQDRSYACPALRMSQAGTGRATFVARSGTNANARSQ